MSNHATDWRPVQVGNIFAIETGKLTLQTYDSGRTLYPFTHTHKHVWSTQMQTHTRTHYGDHLILASIVIQIPALDAIVFHQKYRPPRLI